LDLEKSMRPTFICSYFEGVDNAAHAYGPYSYHVDEAIAAVDVAIGSLLDGLTQRNILEKVNIMIVSDHGMAQLSNDRVILIDQYINMSNVYIVDLGPVTAIIPNEGKTQEIFNELNGAHPNMTVYMKNNTVPYWEYTNNRRITPIVLVLDDGWSITTSSKYNPLSYTGGNHGYDNRLESMQAFFGAAGPMFKNNYAIDSILNLDIYPLLCHILNLQEAPNNGTLRSDILKDIPNK